MFGMGCPMAAAALWGVCLICLAWAAQWLRPLYEACALYVWHVTPYGCARSMGSVLNMFGLGRPMPAAALWGVCFICLAWAACSICLAWAALWLRPPSGACAQYLWHGPPYGCGCSMGRVLNVFGMGRPYGACA